MKDFPPFRLDTVNQCLWRCIDGGQDQRILLKPTAFAILLYLVDHAGRLVRTDELRVAVWPNTTIQPGVLKRHIFEIRAALGDDPKRPTFIETLPRLGYRFLAPIHEYDAPPMLAPVRRGHGRVVGRDRELGQLRGSLEAAAAGQRQIVFVTGETGIGKTTLVDEFERKLGTEFRIRVARGQCVEGYGGKEPYYPMLEALGNLCRGPAADSVVPVLRAQAPTWLVQFPALVKQSEREVLQREILGATRERMLREIGGALRTITAATPLLLVLEDLQWVDHSTVDLISALARGREPAKLLLIATYRPSDVALSQQHSRFDQPLNVLKQELLVHQLGSELALGPLGEIEIATYLASESPDCADAPEDLAILLHKRSDGNPLFMVSVLDHMLERGLISRQNAGWQLVKQVEEIVIDVPESLRQLIEGKIARLTKDEQRVLEVASVAGAKFSTRVTAAAANFDLEKFGDVCKELSHRGLILRFAGSQYFPDANVSDRYQFLHSLYREVLYGRQGAGSRATLHARIGEQLEKLFADKLSEVAAELAHHFEHSYDWTRAVTYLGLAADIAGQRYAHREATLILQRALELAGKIPESERAFIETELLAKLANIYVLAFDIRAIETYEKVAAQAAQHNLVDVEARGLVDMAYALSWLNSDRCLKILERALELSTMQKQPLMRARTRASCLARRIWAGGWNAQDAEECERAIAIIRQTGDPFAIAAHLIDYSFIQWVSTEYREARRNAIESLATLLSQVNGNPYLSAPYRLSQFILPWSLLYVGEWGEMLRELKAGIAMADRNGASSHGQTIRVLQAWLLLAAMDFQGVVEICNAVLPSLTDSQEVGRRHCLILAGSAQTALGNHDRALEILHTVGNEMDHETVIFDWYRRMMLGSALTELSLARGDLQQAHSYAEGLVNITHATAERTWQALAWEISARVALAERDLEKARDCINRAVLRMEGYEVPLAAWSVHATGAELAHYMGNTGLVEYHCQLSRATILKISNSLAADDPLRSTFLSAPKVRKVIEMQCGVKP